MRYEVADHSPHPGITRVLTVAHSLDYLHAGLVAAAIEHKVRILDGALLETH